MNRKLRTFLIMFSASIGVLIASTRAQTPLATFHAPPGWYFTPGTYRVTLIARRALVPWPLQASFTVTLSQATVDFLNQHPHKFLPVSIGPGHGLVTDSTGVQGRARTRPVTVPSRACVSVQSPGVASQLNRCVLSRC